MAIATRYTGDLRVQIYVNEKNLGDYPNRNRAAEMAQGKYLKYLDSDNVIYPHGLDVMVRAMDQFPDAAMALERPPSKVQPNPVKINPREAYLEHFIGGGLLDSGPTGTILRASSFRRVGGFSGKRFVGDLELWLKLGARWPIVKLTRGLVWWREHEQQEYVLGHASLGYLESTHPVWVAALTAPECPLNSEERAQVLAELRQRHARRLLRLGFRKTGPFAVWRVMQATHFKLSDLMCALGGAGRRCNGFLDCD